MSAENKVYERVAFFDFFADLVLLHHAAAKRNDKVGVCFFDVFERTDVTVNSVLRVFSYGAGVVKHKVGFFNIVREAIAHLGEQTFYSFTVRYVALTAVGVNHGEGSFVRVF